MERMNSYIYGKSMSDYCTRIASVFKMSNQGDLAAFYASAARGFQMRADNVTFAEVENEERIASLINK